MAKQQVSSQNMGAMRFETASLNAVKAAEDDFEQLNKLGGMMILVVLESTTSQHLLRSIMQKQKNINYILLGSQESMMTDNFENKKSPFYHFGELMRLAKLPRDEYHLQCIEATAKGWLCYLL